MLAAEEPPAIRKLGRLFKLTEVHLWDDSCGAGANVSHKHWRSAETGFAVSQTVKTHNKPAIQTNEGHSFVEDLELANLMGSLGLPVSFSTSKEKKKTAKKGKKKGRQALCEAANTPMDDAVRTMDDAVMTMDDAVRTCANTEEIESVVELMACVQHINSCSSSRTDVGYNEAFHDDIGKMLGEDSFYVVEREESGCSAEIVPGDEAENHSELRTCRFNDNMSNPVKSDSPVRENQAVDCVLQLSKEMLGQNSVDNESRISCAEIFQEGRLSTRDDQISGETPSISHDNNDVDREPWVNDERFLVNTESSNSMVWSFRGRIAYPKDSRLMSRGVAPDNVYNSARSVRSEGNVTWGFPVPAGSRYLVRMHFCDIVSKALYELYFNIYVNGHLAVNDFDISSATGFLAYPYYIDFVVDVEDEGMLKLGIGGSKKSRLEEVSGILNALEIMRMNKTGGGMDGDFPVALDMEYVVSKGIREFAHSLLCGLIFTGLLLVLVMLVLRLRTELRNNCTAWPWQPKDSGNGKLARAYQLVPTKTDY